MSEYEAAVGAFTQTPSFQYESPPSTARIGYQYRGFQSFWSIIKSDSFWATDARFSNDAQEQRFAASIFAHRAKKSVTLNEDYIVCFCAENDKLSQWRGYAPQGGVSMGFDFDGTDPFYIPLAGKPLGSPITKDDYRQVFVQYGKVLYLNPRKEGESDEAYYSACYDAISNHACPKDGIGAAPDDFWDEVRKSAPFIKHSGFAEENEWRLVFRNEDQSLSPCVCYHEPDGNGIRRPYILVHPGNPEYDSKPCVVRLCVDDRFTSELLTRLRSELGKDKVDSCWPKPGPKDKTDGFCYGCTHRRWISSRNIKRCRYQTASDAKFYLGIYRNENSITISQGDDQEKVFETVHAVVKKFLEEKCAHETEPTKIPVWCEGHLPLRSLTVGPCIRQWEMMDAIQHYCNHTYWLQDVEITASEIPFRRST